MKTFVLRTNSLLSSTDSTLRFGHDNEVVIPLAVIDELQHYKGRPEKCKVAAQILEYIETFDISKLTSPKGVEQSNGSILKIAKNYHDVEVDLEEITESDKRVFQVCLGIKKDFPEKNVILISKNASIRIKARMLGINAEDFRDDLFPVSSQQYTGREKVYISSEALDNFYKERNLSISEVYENDKIHWEQNMFVEMHAFTDSALRRYTGSSALGRYDGEKIVPLAFEQPQYPYGIVAKNAGQRMFMESLLMDWNEAPLVIAKGSAGTGKTFCSLAYALAKVEEGEYSRILVATPSETVGNEKLGYLPGDVKSKISPYLGGIKDNLSIILGADGKNKGKGKEDMQENGEYYFERGIIEVQPIGFLRGRTIVNSIFIIDETQNIDPGDIKSIVTRAAEGSKFIFLGDPTQVDNPKLNERYNGLVYLSEKMKGNPLCWQVSLTGKESVRSKLSQIASEIL